VTRLVFVDRREDAPPPADGTDVVVIDPAWTPGATERADIAPLRPILQAVLDEHDVIHASLELLDAWAESAHLADGFTADGVTWWFQVRMLLRWDAHELVLWLHVLDRLAPADRYDTIEVAKTWPALAAAARSRGGARRSRTRVIVPGAPGAVRRAGGTFLRGAERVPGIGRAWRLGVRGVRGLRHGAGLLRWLSPGRPARGSRLGSLDRRLGSILDRPAAVLAVTWPRAFQEVVAPDGTRRRVDPQLQPPLARLSAEGRPVVAVGLGLDHRREADGPLLEADPTLLPESLLTGRYLRPLDVLLDSTQLARNVARAGRVRAEIAGTDLGPAFGALAEPYTGAWLDWQRLRLRWAERLLRELRPGALLTNREGSRTAWLAAADRLRIPTVAVQHGMIFPGNPEYCHAAHPKATRPGTTCVFGEYERDLLVNEAGYPPANVVVTGSPRGGVPDATPEPGDPADRDAVRRELGVADGNRLLVVSVAHNRVLGELHAFAMLARLLGGSLPGVHVAIKLHPQDDAEPRHASMLRDLARAGGWPPAIVTTVRDIDLFRLLRAADAHLGQYSTVLSDAVVSGTPNMIAVGQAYADALGYVAARVAVPVRSVDDVRAFLADPRPPAPEDRAAFLAAHFRAGDAAGRIADILRAAS
jgi:hypothetical protein